MLYDRSCITEVTSNLGAEKEEDVLLVRTHGRSGLDTFLLKEFVQIMLLRLLSNAWI